MCSVNVSEVLELAKDISESGDEIEVWGSILVMAVKNGESDRAERIAEKLRLKIERKVKNV